MGGNRKKFFTEGWVEFEDKKVAKSVASALNATPIGGKGFHKFDLWNLKYLKGFKWSHLHEKLGEIEKYSRLAKFECFFFFFFIFILKKKI